MRGYGNRGRQQRGGSKNNIFITPSSPYSIHGFTPTGNALSSPWPVVPSGEVCGLAVTNSGEVWGGNYSGSVSKFGPAGPFIENFPLGQNVCKIAVDQTNNDLYIAGYGSQKITKYAAPGYTQTLNIPVGEGETLGDNNPGLAINGASNKLYVANYTSQVKVFDTDTGDLVETFDAGGSTRGIAVNESNDTVWLTTNDAIKEFPGILVPKVTTGEPTGNVSVAGTADPDGAGNVTECFFEYGPGFTSTKSCDQALPITTPTAVTATLTGLEGEQPNQYRLVLGNVNGQARGAIKQITPHNVKGLQTEAATSVTRDSAELHASFAGDGTDTHYYFEWGESPAYETGQSAIPPGPSIGSPISPPRTDLSFSPTGLDPEKLYYFRVVAENASGKSPGQGLTFTTLPAVQSLSTDAATEITGHTAKLNASYLGDGTPTSYYFEYGPSTSSEYGTKTDVFSAGTAGTVPLFAVIEGLALSKSYHYRVIATNSRGITKGPDRTVVTEGAVKGVVTLPATDITLQSLTLNGQYLGDGRATSYWFEYGPTTAYGTKTEVIDAGAPSGVTSLPIEIADFEGFLTYHVRLVAENVEGVTLGNDLTFDTPDALLPEISGTTASAEGSTAGVLEAEIKPNRWKTVYRVQYGVDTNYGLLTPLSAPVGSDLSKHTITESIQNLLPRTTYHLRLIAINFVGTAYGEDVTMTTPDLPTVVSSTVSSVGQTTAHLGALVAGNASPTTVRFEYGATPFYGASTAAAPAGTSLLGEPVQATLAEPIPGTTYHLRAVAVNEIGATTGSDITFTTKSAPSGTPIETTPPKCKKGFVKKHGKCVKKKKRKKKGSKSK